MSHHETPRERRAGEAVTWAWATRQGAAEWASTEQLIFWLQRGDLPPSVLVWKPGWGGWLPALQVAELAAVLSRGTPSSPSEAPKASHAPAAAAAPSIPTLSPHAIDLALPAALRAAAPTQEQPAKPWGWLGKLTVGAVAVLSVGSSWAAFSLAMSGLQSVEPASPQSAASAQPAASGAVLPPPAAPAEPARAARPEAKPTVERAPLTREPNPVVLRVGDLPTARSRELSPMPRAGRRGSNRR